MINYLAEQTSEKIIISTHPRTKKKIDSTKVKLNNKIILLKPLSYTDYSKLQITSNAVISDSGTITEESSILNFPALNIREVHERHEGMEEGSVMMVGLNINLIVNALKIIKKQGRDKKRTLRIVADYNTDNVSEKIVRIILSYTQYVKREVWKKYD